LLQPSRRRTISVQSLEWCISRDLSARATRLRTVIRARGDAHGMTRKDYDDDFGEYVSIGRLRRRLPVAAKIAFVTADNGCRCFTNATWSFCVLNQVRLHHRHLFDTHRQIAIEIASGESGPPGCTQPSDTDSAGRLHASMARVPTDERG